MSSGKPPFPQRIENIKSATIVGNFEIQLDPRLQLGEAMEGTEIFLKSSGTMALEVGSGLQSFDLRKDIAKMEFGGDGRFNFRDYVYGINAFIDNKFIGTVNGFPVDGKASVTLILARPPEVVIFKDRASPPQAYNNILKLLLPWFALITILVWMSQMWERLVTDPWLIMVLLLGVIALLFNGTVTLGIIKIQKK